MSVMQTLGSISDAAILADLQALGTTVAITAYSTQAVTNARQVTWESTPGPEDQNTVASYFQQESYLRSWA